MSNNKNKLGMVHSSKLFKSIGQPIGNFVTPTFGKTSIVYNQAGDNPNARCVTCLGCNKIIWPHEDAWGLEYKAHYRYICRSCYISHGFIW